MQRELQVSVAAGGRILLTTPQVEMNMFPIAYMTFLGSELGRGFGGWGVDSLAGGYGVGCSVGGPFMLSNDFNCDGSRLRGLPGSMQNCEVVNSVLQPRPSRSGISFHAGGEPDSTGQGAPEDSLNRTFRRK